ncbi:STAS domain-containing protein [bacterium]|nr:STAS domain-containing protein [bacterium]
MIVQATYSKDAVLYIKASGKLDIYNAPDYLEEVKEHLKKYANEYVLDFSEITFVASIGLRAILSIYKIAKAKGCSLKLINVNKDILHSFQITGFDEFLTIENDSENQNTEQN